jgi:mannosyl-3-phosphoglycerate phosphatase
MMNGAAPSLSSAPFLLIFTDLDGTLLDSETYSWEDAREAIVLCRKGGVPVIPASSKTRAEIEVLRRQIPLPGPFISENGGGIFFPMTSDGDPPPEAVPDGNLWKWAQGMPYEKLVPALQDIGSELGITLLGFSQMPVHQIADLTGLDLSMARLAATREFDEPFVIRSPGNPDIAALRRAAEQRGLTITEGGRFFHLHTANDKGKAVERVVSLYRQRHRKVISVALGDSPNDFPMLEQADLPVLIRSKRHFPGLEKRIPGLVVTREEGPNGWNEAVSHILESRSGQE